ncbi:MAG: aminoacyl-tRNA hydrolase [Gemmatimonadota bacterium]|nr:aminoacyl-tRNA hydrolase [Gemmatimonadota bacterium]
MTPNDQSANDGLVVTPHVTIPIGEIELTAITGSGPGGQHVNRSATRIALRWNIRTTCALDEMQRERALGVLSSRVDADGAIRIVAGEYRSQMQNRAAALERLSQLLARALIVQKKRKPTRPTKSSIERRLTEKRSRANTKRDRRTNSDD